MQKCQKTHTRAYKNLDLGQDTRDFLFEDSQQCDMISWAKAPPSLVHTVATVAAGGVRFGVIDC